ncbi:MAG: LacI family DNA-binding transcriptional regulator [Sphingobacteriia bacterium]|jgi:LacI family transcriptional regulator
MNNTTLKKIAGIVGCSISTVSRALKHHPDISVATRERIIELANTLDYEPNAFAVHLRTKHSNVIGLMVPFISNLFYESFIDSVEEECRKNGFTLMILQTANDPKIEIENLKLFRQNRVMGLFVCVSSNSKSLAHYEKMKDVDIPVVFFDNVPNDQEIIKVCMADERAAEMAAEAIQKTKKKKILALFGDLGLTITQKRLKAFQESFQKTETKCNIDIVHINKTEDALKEVSNRVSKKIIPSIIFCMSDEILIGAMKALQSKKLTIPNQIGIISISNGFIPSLYYPTITYVETSGFKLGKLAFTQLLACLSGSVALTELTLDAVLFEGGSL